MSRYAGPSASRMVEVGPRDGLQNEAKTVPAAIKIALIDRLGRRRPAGDRGRQLRLAEMGAADGRHAEVMAGIARKPGVSYPVLVPNMKGFEAARAAKAEEIAVFGAASETFSRKNINCSIDESLDRFAPVCEAAKRDGIRVRGYVSCVLGCPYEGEIAPAKVAHVSATAAATLGCYEISLGDTIGVGTPAKAARDDRDGRRASCRASKLAVHFHDTYGQALANILAALGSRHRHGRSARSPASAAAPTPPAPPATSRARTCCTC